MLTFIPIEEMDKWDDSRINEKKEILAYDLTKLVHGEEEAGKAREASHALFSGVGDDSHMPTTEFDETEIPEEGISILDLMVMCKLSSSKSEARRLVLQGGVSIDGNKVDHIEKVIKRSELASGIKIKKGKKVFHRVVMK